MNILFIWDKGKLGEWREKCVLRAKEMYPDANFKCITFEDEFYNMEIIPMANYSEKFIVSPDNILGFSDYIRFDYLSNFPDTLYMDTDVICKKPYKFTDDAGSVNIQVMWNGKDLKAIRDVYSKHDNQQILWHLRNELRKADLSNHFEHKPKWAKSIWRKPIPQNNLTGAE